MIKRINYENNISVLEMFGLAYVPSNIYLKLAPFNQLYYKAKVEGYKKCVYMLSDFNMSTYLGLFYIKTLGNCIHCTFISTII